VGYFYLHRQIFRNKSSWKRCETKYNQCVNELILKDPKTPNMFDLNYNNSHYELHTFVDDENWITLIQTNKKTRGQRLVTSHPPDNYSKIFNKPLMC